MRRYLVVPGILLVLVLTACKSETRVEESTAAPPATATTASETVSMTVQEVQPGTDTMATIVPTPVETATTAPVGTQPPAATTPATKPAAKPAPAPVTKPATQTTAPVVTPTPKPAPAPVPEAKPVPVTPTPTPAPAPSTTTTTTTTKTTSSKVPKNHTIDKDGVKHAPGFETPATRCAVCHGKDLKGARGPSCFECHEKKWK